MLKKTWILFIVLFQSSCSTGENCDFDITGTWQITITVAGTVVWTFTFTGSATEGSVTGFSYPDPVVGTYSVSNCTSLTFIFDYFISGYQVLWTFNGVLTSETTMNGSLTIYVAAGPDTHFGTWTAIKL
jgi:hypothetical protein